MTQEKRKHGGYRPGAGRKAVENKRVQVTATVERDTRDTIKDYCKARQTRLGRLLDTMVEQGFFNKEDWLWRKLFTKQRIINPWQNVHIGKRFTSERLIAEGVNTTTGQDCLSFTAKKKSSPLSAQMDTLLYILSVILALNGVALIINGIILIRNGKWWLKQNDK